MVVATQPLRAASPKNPVTPVSRRRHGQLPRLQTREQRPLRRPRLPSARLRSTPIALAVRVAVFIKPIRVESTG